MATPPQAAAPAPASQMAPGIVFKPNGACLVKHYLVPRALHGRVPESDIQDGVDVFAARPEALPFPSCSRRQHCDCEEVWGYFFMRRPAAAVAGAAAGTGAGGSDDREDVRAASAVGCWRRYGGGEKEYVGDDGGVIALRGRLAFYEAATEDGGGGKLTQWRAKEFRLNEAAAAFRGATFHPGAEDLVIWKVYNEVDIPEQPSMAPYYSSSDDDDDDDDDDDNDDDDDDDDDDPNVSKKMKTMAGGLPTGSAADAASS
ncbi:hypothetical protein ACP70R_009820 [Stipagrostis hirtigluma subsp. patula]